MLPDLNSMGSQAASAAEGFYTNGHQQGHKPAAEDMSSESRLQADKTGCKELS